jgi:hypothetical protein
MKSPSVTGQQSYLRALLQAAFVALLLWFMTGPGLAQRPATEGAAQQLAFGQTQTGSIGTPAEIDTYTFVANAGDTVLIAISRASGDLWPRIRLYQPGGLLLVDEDAPTQVEVSQVLPVAGIYSIRISDGFNETLTGGYGLYLQRLNAPGNATPLSFGQTTIGSIAQTAEMDTFTFDAQENDAILVSISQASGDLWPQIRVYDPAGNVVGINGDPVHAEITLVVSQRWVSYLPLVVRSSRGTTASAEPSEEQERGVHVRASLPGTYTILVADDLNGTQTGSYGLHLQQLNSPDNATPIDFGQTKTGSINQVAEMDAYSFMATAGDVVLVGASQATGDMWPRVRLYDPAGNLVGTSGDSRHTEVQVTLASRGAHTLLISDDFDGTLTGVYGLHLQRLNNPGNAAPIDFGQTLTGSINQAAEMDAYTFAADAGDVVLIGAGRSTGNLWPQIRIFDPEGSLVGIAADSTHAEVQVMLAASGTYTLLIADDLNGSHTGGYGLHLQRLNNPGNARALVYGDLVSATINMVAEMDAYTFSGSAGDAIVINMARTSGSLWPQIRLFDPDGEAAGTASGSTSAELNTTLTEAGTYTILAADDLNGTLTGGYDLQIQKTTR